MTHRGNPNVLVVLLGPLESAVDGVDIRRRVVGVAVVLALETVGEECGPAVALDDFLHSAGKVVRALELAFGTGHGGRDLGPVGGAVLAHFIIHALPAAVADTAHDVVLENGAFVRHVAVRVGDRDDAVLLVDFAFDGLFRRGFFAAHVIAVAIAVACNFVPFVGQALESAPVGVPVHHHVEGSLVAILLEHRASIGHVARSTVIEREGSGALAETRPGCNFDVLCERGSHREQPNRRCGKENLFHKIYSIIMIYTIKLCFCREDCLCGKAFPLYRIATRKWRILSEMAVFCGCC